MTDKIIDIHITSAEWEIMKVIWANKEATSKFVSEVLCEEMGWKNSTIKTLLNRLLDKRILEKREVGNKFVYYTNYTFEDVSRQELQEIYDKVCKTKVGNLIAYSIENNELSIDDIKNIQEKIKNKIEKNEVVKKVKCDCLPGQCNCEYIHSKNLKK